MGEMSRGHLTRVLGLKESISMTIGTVVGVGLFTCGSAQIGYVGSWIIVFTFIALLISIWPCLIYGEMSAALPFAGGTYQYAKRGMNRGWANLAGWHYIVSVVAIGAGETLAFSNYFKILLEQLGWDISFVDSRLIAIALVLVFLGLNYCGIKQSGKVQTIFVFFFWGCSILWFLYMIPQVHVSYFGALPMNELPPFSESMYIFGLVWWCYTGFETCISMGSETKAPQLTLPRALKLSVFLVFAVNALFQWFLVGLVPKEWYGMLAAAEAPYAEGLKAVGLIGFPVILLCIGIAFGGDLSTINPGIAAPSRYIYAMAEDSALPSAWGKIHPRHHTPHVAILIVGAVNIFLIATNSIVYIASISLISLAIVYMIGCLSYLGLKRRYPDLHRPYLAPFGKLGCYTTIAAYTFMILFADPEALATAAAVTGICILFYYGYTRRHRRPPVSIEDEIGMIGEINAAEQASMDKEYILWKRGTIIVSAVALGIYVVPLVI